MYMLTLKQYKTGNLPVVCEKGNDKPIIYAAKVENWVHLAGEKVHQLLFSDNFYMPLKARAASNNTQGSHGSSSAGTLTREL